MVLAELISEYLKSNRRLVVPQLGAFLVKEPDHKIFFSTFLKKDDGALRDLLLSSGLSDVEVEALLNRLLFEIRYAVENREIYSLMGVGNFSGDENGALTFTEWVGETVLVEDAPVGNDVEDAVPEKAEEEFEEEFAPKTSVEEESTQPKIEPVERRVEAFDSVLNFDEPLELQAEDEPSVTNDEEDDEPKIVYTRPERVKRANGGNKKRPDIWMILAIAVVLLALGVILYGFFVDSLAEDDGYASVDTIETVEDNLV